MGEINVSMEHCVTVHPKFAGEMRYFFEINELETLFNCLISKYDQDIPKRKLPRSTTSNSIAALTKSVVVEAP